MLDQRTPWGGGKRRGVENLTNDTPPKKGFWTPPRRYVFHPPQASALCFSCTKNRDRADQKLFWMGPKIFGRARSLVRFPPPIRLAPPHITAQLESFLVPESMLECLSFRFRKHKNAGSLRHCRSMKHNMLEILGVLGSRKCSGNLRSCRFTKQDCWTI